MSAAMADSSSPELVRVVTPSLVFLVKMLTTLLEDALAFPLDFLFVTVVIEVLPAHKKYNFRT